MYYGEAIRKWEETFILSYDGGGEVFSTVLSVRTANENIILKSIKWPNSLGHFYSFFTGYLGFRMLEGEYKMMGLAPYGKPIYKDIILSKILKLEDNGNYSFNYLLCDYHSALNGNFNPSLVKYFGLPRDHKQEPTVDHINLATSVQAAFEECEKHILLWAKNKFPKINKLVVTGGCGLNVTANGKILDTNIVDEIIVPPAPHDAGCAIGANIAFLHKKMGKSYFNKMINCESPYLGANFSNDEISKAFTELNLEIPRFVNDDELTQKAAFELSKTNIIAWFQGKAEFGPRALGARSFLADPREDNIRELVNVKIKKRELFRPFAPSVTIEAAKIFFEINQESPYMNIVAKVHNTKRKIIPAVTHIDGTARVHTVTAKSNPIYHKLLEEFGKITGVPVLLNTSFNIQEPIVYTPKNAIETYLKSGVDFLFIGNYICDINWKNNQTNRHGK
jgi:carbamoyltransferase